MKSHLLFFLFLIQMCCLALAQSAATIVLPGSKKVSGHIIGNYTNKWKVTHISADGTETPNRIWTDYGQIIELNGKKYFHRVQDLYDPAMNLQETWINMVEHQSLKPVSFSRITSSGKVVYSQFDGKKVKTLSNHQSEDFVPKENKSELDEEVFDWNLYGMLLVGLPFEDGQNFRLPIYEMQTGKLDWLVATMEGKETIKKSAGKQVSAFKIGTNKNLTFWLTKEVPYVHQLELKLQNGAKLIWETL